MRALPTTQALLEVGKAKLGTTDAEGRTAAWHACANGCARALEVLHSRAPGFKWATRADNAGVTPLRAACTTGEVGSEGARFLIEVVGLKVDQSHVEAATAAQGKDLVAFLKSHM